MRKIISLLTVWALLFAWTVNVQAQERSPQEVVGEAQEAGNEGGLVVVSEINIGKAELLSGAENKFTVAITIENRGEKVETGLRYGVVLFEKGSSEDATGDMVDEFYADDAPFSLAPGASVVKEIVYDAPAALAGEFTLGAAVVNTAGLQLAPAIITNVAFEAQGVPLYVSPDSCTMRIDGSEESFTTGEGVDVNSEENLYVLCTLENQSENDVDYAIEVITYKRNFSGEVTETQMYDMQRVVANTKEELRLDVPKVSMPQAYGVRFELKDQDGQKIANPVLARYVLQGESATVQHVRIDKSSYNKGDVAEVNVSIAAQADFFPEARGADVNQEMFENKTDLIYNVVTEIEGCSESVITTMGQNASKGISQDIKVPITKNCPNPNVSVSIETADGEELDSANLTGSLSDDKSHKSGSSRNILVNNPVAEKVKGMSPFVLFTIIGSLILAMIILLARKKDATKVMIFGLIGAGGIIAASSADAVVLTAQSRWGEPEGSQYDYSIQNNNSCYPRISGNLRLWGCGNNPTASCATVELNGNIIGQDQTQTGSLKWVGGNLPNGGRNGNHSANVQLKWASHCRWGDANQTEDRRTENYTVQCGQPSSCSHTLSSGTRLSSEPGNKCSNGGEVRNYSNQSDRWTWTCRGTDGSWSVPCGAYKQAPAVNGQCGSGHGTSGRTSQPSGSSACSRGSFSEQSDTSSRYQWRCNGTGGGSNASCYANRVSPTNGSCGSANGGTFTSVPTNNRCSSGTASGVNTSSSSYTWDCWGYNGGTHTSCSANRQALVTGQCGSANGGSFANKSALTSSQMCSRGTASSTWGTWSWRCNSSGGNSGTCSASQTAPPVNNSCGSDDGRTNVSSASDLRNRCTNGSEDSFVDNGTYWSWHCRGRNGGSSEFGCTATKQPTTPRINGSCGSSAGSCTTGSNQNQSTSGRVTTWQCAGSGGGSTASCSYTAPDTRVNGNCGSSAGSCTAGSAANVTTSGRTTTWQCQGSGGGSNASCSYTAPTTPINGSCGTTAGACTAGSSQNQSNDGAGTTTWECAGSSGGSTANCSVFVPVVVPVNGACSTASNTCSAGTPQNLTPDGSGGSTWQCVGTGGGTTASCSYVAAPVCGSADGGDYLIGQPTGSELCAAGSAGAINTVSDSADPTKKYQRWTCSNATTSVSCQAVSDCGEGGISCNNKCEYISLNGQSVVNHDRSGGVVTTQQTITGTDGASACIESCDLYNSEGVLEQSNVPLGTVVGDIDIVHQPANGGEEGIRIQCRRKPTGDKCDTDTTNDPDCDTDVDKSKTISCVCTARRCSASGQCVAAPIFGASSGSDASCSSECSTDADCGGGGISEVTL